MYDVYEMMCEETRNLMPVSLLSVAVSMIVDIQKMCNHVNRKFIAASVLPRGSSSVNAVKTAGKLNNGLKEKYKKH